jgi:hypothetical protein
MDLTVLYRPDQSLLSYCVAFDHEIVEICCKRKEKRSREGSDDEVICFR